MSLPILVYTCIYTYLLYILLYTCLLNNTWLYNCQYLCTLVYTFFSIHSFILSGLYISFLFFCIFIFLCMVSCLYFLYVCLYYLLILLSITWLCYHQAVIQINLVGTYLFWEQVNRHPKSWRQQTLSINWMSSRSDSNKWND